jgi:hypothetical protein
MTVYVSDAHAHVQRLLSVVKMATVLEGILPKGRVHLCFFYGKKFSMQRKFVKKCFVFTVGSVCRVNRVEKFSQERSKAADDARPGEEVTETTIKRLLCCVFRRSGTNISVLEEVTCVEN